MSFCFNFELTEENGSSSQNDNLVFSSSGGTDLKEKESKDQFKKCSKPAFEVNTFYEEAVISKLETKAMILNDFSLDVVDTNQLEHLMTTDKDFQSCLCKSNSLADIVTHSDLKDGVYEGGLKVWECGLDLAKFLSSHPSKLSFEIAEKRVLEIGCGAGLPGLYCIKSGAECVDFQDYNEEVLKILTHTNVEKNFPCPGSATNPQCRYFAGDWGSFCDLVDEQQKYDLILSAETIYNEENYKYLHRVLDKMLSHDGIVLIAAKVYYFGVGGSIDAFLEFLHGQDCFVSETVWETSSGVPRKILKLQRRPRETSEDNT